MNIRDLVDDPACARIVNAVNQIGLGLGITSIAKNVDSERTLAALRSMDIAFAQGRAIGVPSRFLQLDGRVTMPALPASINGYLS